MVVSFVSWEEKSPDSESAASGLRMTEYVTQPSAAATLGSLAVEPGCFDPSVRLWRTQGRQAQHAVCGDLTTGSRFSTPSQSSGVARSCLFVVSIGKLSMP